MSSQKMHADEVDIDADMVRRLITRQLPQWADLPIRPVRSSGTDNALFRLGERMVVRLPRIEYAVPHVDKEQEWLPWLAPQLTLAVPVPLARGRPADGFPWPWSVYPWLGGRDATMSAIDDPVGAAVTLGGFVAALQRIDPAGGPRPGAHNVYRGVPLALRDPFMRKAISALSGVVDVVAVTSAWERALGVPAWSGPPTWIHGDLDRRNVLVEDGRLTAVIDWGCMAVGDPAYDAIAGWSLFAGESREAFRVALEVDDATWERTRGLVLSGGVFGLVTFHPDGTVEGVPYYEETNPVIVDASRRALQDALGDDE